MTFLAIEERDALLSLSDCTPVEATATSDRIFRGAWARGGRGFLAALDDGTCEDVDPDAHAGCSTSSWRCLSSAVAVRRDHRRKRVKPSSPAEHPAGSP